MDSLRPRDIQARIRAGASPEEVASAAGLSLDEVSRFAGPPLAEREWMASRASATEIRRADGTLTLAEVVAARLGVDGDGLSWDSWRRDDGRWTVLVSHGASGQSSTWLFDAAAAHVSPVADDISSVQPDQGRPRLVSVPAAPEHTPARAVDDWFRPSAAESVGVSTTEVDLPQVVDDDDAADEITDAIDSDDDVQMHPIDVDANAADQLAGDIDSTPARTQTTTGHVVPAAADEQLAAFEDPGAQQPATRRRRRASVPSWDDIMFGARGDGSPLA